MAREGGNPVGWHLSVFQRGVPVEVDGSTKGGGLVGRACGPRDSYDKEIHWY